MIIYFSTQKMMNLIVLSICLIATVNAACDNGCSGHGVCGLNDVCACHDGWATGMTKISGDCSDRVCPYDFAFVSKPTNMTKRHEYAECSARGVCDRTTGQCECFEGYEGQACHRTACPNDCSGHGRCKYLGDIPKYGSIYDHDTATDYYQSMYLTAENYHGWDNLKTRGCVCDPGWLDVDCSKRICPHGNDPMTVRKNVNLPDYDQTQTMQFESYSQYANKGRTFSIIYMNKANETFNTMPIVFPEEIRYCHNFVIEIQNALYAIPTNAITKVTVAVDCESLVGSNYVTTINVTFTGANNEGPQHMLIPNTRTCSTPGCSPKQSGLNLVAEGLAGSTFRFNSTELVSAEVANESEECGNRGKCDYETGNCNCFQGYSGLACGTITALY